jgi:hypothetical protein
MCCILISAQLWLILHSAQARGLILHSAQRPSIILSVCINAHSIHSQYCVHSVLIDSIIAVQTNVHVDNVLKYIEVHCTFFLLNYLNFIWLILGPYHQSFKLNLQGIFSHIWQCLNFRQSQKTYTTSRFFHVFSYAKHCVKGFIAYHKIRRCLLHHYSNFSSVIVHDCLIDVFYRWSVPQDWGTSFSPASR